MDLPEDIVREIMSRLPAKDVGRLRCASKPIRSLTMEPSFIKAHTQHSISSSSRRNQPFFLNYGNPAVASSPNQQDLFPFRQPPFKPCTSEYLKLVGCSGGLVCLSKYVPKGTGGMYPNSIYLWNPALGGTDFRELHPSMPDPTNSFYKEFLTFGFGYDSVNDDYKVVNLKLGPSKSQIYSLKNGAWKDISQLFPLNCGFIRMPCPWVNDQAVMVDGFVHWLCICWYYHGGSGSRPIGKPEIVRFDLAAEVFVDRLLAPPKPCREYRLDKLDGQLCAFYIVQDHLDFWVMTEYGVVESWVKQHVISLTRIQFDWPRHPFGITPEGAIILSNDAKGVSLYDSNMPEQKRNSLYVYLDPSSLFVSNYIDCLVSVADPDYSKHGREQYRKGRGGGGLRTGFWTHVTRSLFGLLNVTS